MLLRYEDRNSMAFSIESRVPFLTAELAQFLLSLPAKYLIAPDGTRKWLFRRAMRGLVPDAILDRQDKIGFDTPMRSWLNLIRPQVERLVNSQAASRLPVTNHRFIRDNWSEALEGRCHWPIWRWINLVRWADLHEISF
jgi:asparagine synthase (glutamine-hydrolysing)